jgi:hypothetical protein
MAAWSASNLPKSTGTALVISAADQVGVLADRRVEVREDDTLRRQIGRDLEVDVGAVPLDDHAARALSFETPPSPTPTRAWAMSDVFASPAPAKGVSRSSFSCRRSVRRHSSSERCGMGSRS